MTEKKKNTMKMYMQFSGVFACRPEKQAAAFHEQGAVEALMEMLGMFRLDEVFLRQVVNTLVPLCGQDGGTTDGAIISIHHARTL